MLHNIAANTGAGQSCPNRAYAVFFRIRPTRPTSADMTLPDPITLGATRLGAPVFLAPMAGITDLPFRRAVARHGGAGLMVSEMVASTEMVTPRPSTRAAVRAKALTEGALPVSVQIAGREAGAMAETARIVAGMGARIEPPSASAETSSGSGRAKVKARPLSNTVT